MIATGISDTERGKVLKGLLVIGPIASPVQANVASFESFPNISKLRVQLALALTYTAGNISQRPRGVRDQIYIA